MLSILGPKSRYCDGISRRGFMKIGGLSFGAGGFTLADLMRAEAATGTGSSHKAVINIFLGGGPPHSILSCQNIDQFTHFLLVYRHLV